MKFFLKTCVLLLLTAGSFLIAKPSIYLLDYYVADYPETKADIFLFGETSDPLENLQTQNFLVTNNANSFAPRELTCPTQDVDNSLSLVLSIDLAARNQDQSPNNFNISKNIAYEIIKLLDTVNSDCGISGFTFSGFLYQEITNKKSLLSNAIGRLEPQPASNFNAGLNDKPTGAISIVETAANRKVIILITDGYGEADINTIVSAANEKNIRICFVSVEKELSQSLKEIALATGGGWIDKISSATDLESAAKAILAIAKGYKPCQMAWEGELNCDLIHYITITHLPDDSKTSFHFSIPDSIKPLLESNPPFLGFSSVLPFTKKSLDIYITAKNDNVTVHNMSIPNPLFDIKAGKITNDTILKIGEPHLVSIEFSPQDSAIVFTELNINASACFGKEIFITGGFPNTPPRERTIKIDYPNCGETLIIGDTALVEWTGLLPKDVIQLEYSVNNGLKWDTLAKDASGLFYKWTVPDRPSRECLVRAVQLWPNNIGKTIDLKHNGRVNAAFFNKIGHLAISVSSDTTAVIWDANNGKEIFTLRDHTQPVLFADFDPNGQYQTTLLVTSSLDSTAKIWRIDINKPEPQLLHTLRGHTDRVWSCKFSPDGRNIVTSSKDGKVMVWKVSDGSFVKTVDGLAQPVFFASFSPDSKYILTAGNDGYARMFDWVNSPNTASKVFDTHFGAVFSSVYHADFNHDGTKIVTSSTGARRIASVWNVATVDTLFTVTHNSDTSSNVSINFSSFFLNPNNNREYLLTSGDDEARLWSVDFPTLPFTPFHEHTASVRTAIFNFDGMRVLTSSWDSTAKIWNLDQRDLQMDTSDCNFRIARASVIPADIEFGEVALSEHADTMVAEFLVNESDFEFEISKIQITGGNKDDFTILSGNAPYTIDAEGKAKIEIRFKPQAIGLRQSSIFIKMPGNEYTTSIKGIGIDPGLQAHALIEFNQVELGDYKDVTIDEAIKNRSLGDIRINKITVKGPDTAHFSIVEAESPKNLISGASMPMTIRFIPESIGRMNSRIAIEHNGKGSPTFMNLFGEGVSPNQDTLTLSLSSFEGEAGEIVEMPVRIRNVGNNGIKNSITGLSIYLRFNSTLLEPLGSFESDAIDGSERVIKLSVPLNIPADSILQRIQFKVGLGNDSLTFVNLEHTSPVGTGKLKIFEESAIFRLKGICMQGKPRLIDTEGKLQLSQNVPNPFGEETKIEFEVIENGRTKLFITDFSGRVVETLIEDYLTKGVYSVSVDASLYPSGSYYYILQTPTGKMIRSMLLEK